MQTIPLPELSIVFIPTAFLLAVMFRWQLKAWVGLYANVRMLLQLLLVGYFLTYVFDTTQPIVIVVLVANDGGLCGNRTQIVQGART